MSDIPDIPTRQWAYAESDVRVVPRGAPLPDRTPERDETDQILDKIIDDSEKWMREARDLWAKAIKRFSIVKRPQHANLETMMNQQIEEVIEYRRLHH